MYHFLAAFAVLISIHAPRAGSDQMSIITSKWCWRFQSTLPVRGATISLLRVPRLLSNFNPRSPCGERRCNGKGTALWASISIHAPRAGSDDVPGVVKGVPRGFQSTLPVRGATVPGVVKGVPRGFQSTLPCGERPHWGRLAMLQQEISIHAPRAGSDLLTSSALQARSNFNPRSPCGERPPASPTRFPAMDISIHAPRAGSDSAPLVWRQAGLLFQSTLPVRGATLTAFGRNVARDDFNPRSPCGERRLELHCGRGNIHFNPRSPCGERPDRNAIASKLLDFNPRSPCGERQSASFCAVRPVIFQSTLPVRGATISPT